MGIGSNRIYIVFCVVVHCVISASAALAMTASSEQYVISSYQGSSGGGIRMSGALELRTFIGSPVSSGEISDDLYSYQHSFIAASYLSHIDLDNDGYSRNLDCNDNDSNEHPGQIWFQDHDDDGYSSGITDTTSCTRPDGYKIASELITVSGDLDDNNNTIYPNSHFLLTVMVEGSGVGHVASDPGGINCNDSCGAGYVAGTEVLLSATAVVGSRFEGWQGAECSATESCWVSLDRAQNIIAVFTACNAVFTDTDCDQLDDTWEYQYFGGLDSTGEEDMDNDGASEVDEFASRTDPTVPDSRLQLVVGMNLVSIPLVMDSTLYASELLSAMAPSLLSVSRIDQTTQRVETISYNDGTPQGDDFMFIPGVGYTFTMIETADRLFSGDVATDSIDLAVGSNLVGFIAPLVDYSAYQLLQDIGDASVISSIQRFNRETGLFETASYNGAVPVGPDFKITRGEGYLIVMHQDVTGFVLP